MTAVAELGGNEQIFAERCPLGRGKFADHSIDCRLETVTPDLGELRRAQIHGGFTLGTFSQKIELQMFGQRPPEAKGLM